MSNKQNVDFANKEVIISGIALLGIKKFCSSASFMHIPEDGIERARFIIALVTSRSVADVTDEVIEDQFISVKKYLITQGLHKLSSRG